MGLVPTALIISGAVGKWAVLCIRARDGGKAKVACVLAAILIELILSSLPAVEIGFRAAGKKDFGEKTSGLHFRY